MGYHILLATKENFELCRTRGVYGGVRSSDSPKSEQINSEVVAGFSAVKPSDFVMFYVKNIGFYGLWKVTTKPFYDDSRLWSDPRQLYPFRFCFEPVVRE